VAELVPIPLATLLRRAHAEWTRRRAVFDLPEQRFHRAAADLDCSIAYGGGAAATPVGPAAGPHTQLAQNIALGWLGGARVFELKTIQANDRLTLSRPCIDMAAIGYNTEWSQELRLEDSLREYVKASMLLDALDAMGVLGQPGGAVMFDVSVGYDLAGITSAPVVAWLGAMREATAIVEDLRGEIPRDLVGIRDLPFRTRIADGITLSTFHGTPPDEIERIVEFLAGELGFHTVIKLNPPMLGRARVEDILHGTLGYAEVEVNPACYDRALGFDDAAAMVKRLRAMARRRGVDVGVKCGNTLEVLNRGTYLKEPVQYLSGQPLHALHAALALQWREAFGDDLAISFSAGVDAHNVADCVAAGLVPVTTCTDLLRTGGYTRLARYFQNLEGRMRAVKARTLGDFVANTARARGSDGSPGTANLRHLLDAALSDPRYRAGALRKPRKLGTHLWRWDCLSCSKCIPVCPNDALFEVEVDPFVGHVPIIEVDGDGWRETAQVLYRALKPTQIALLADACNECGNCDVFCPEDGGPFAEKPRFFLSGQAFRQAAPLPGFSVERRGTLVTIHGRFADAGTCTLTRDLATAYDVFEHGHVTGAVDRATHLPVSAALLEGIGGKGHGTRDKGQGARDKGQGARDSQMGAAGQREPCRVSLAPAVTLQLLLTALLREERVNFVSVIAAPDRGLATHG
jgi:putative selenate reductase